MALTLDERSTRAKGSLVGLSVGDAFGDQFFLLANRDVSTETGMPPAPWNWSDDTEMACSVTDVLNQFGQINQDALARAFAERMDIDRRYGAGALELLERIQQGVHWRTASRELFGGRGSFGNGAAMRVAPLGAHFADDLDRAAEQAALSAEVTHAHPEGIAGAVAIAVAAAHAASRPGAPVDPRELIETALDRTTMGEYVRRGLQRSLRLLKKTPREAAHELGNGNRISAQDTVPFALWAAATRLDDYESAVRACVTVGGDMDTTAAMVGGIIAAHRGPGAIPEPWLQAREPLPEWLSF
ncbi:ADP-ribosylglycohydrolase family protein [Actinomadura algeriensis]|uniref:ADP-ribosylglycohydrolase n=1 Tax=Actinomadura algeriensis TaxID=1679523 RepID=A0ABR9JUH6_9ACTN|nr:ADP-ribosylglycohydrolase family protein [Actinomadura algeriensis]MBE1534059.1 ADP-ribosylglycohydrolase [Actinomadura algeriensis]